MSILRRRRHFLNEYRPYLHHYYSTASEQSALFVSPGDEQNTSIIDLDLDLDSQIDNLEALEDNLLRRGMLDFNLDEWVISGSINVNCFFACHNMHKAHSSTYIFCRAFQLIETACCAAKPNQGAPLGRQPATGVPS
jgi:hypothetical protein